MKIQNDKEFYVTNSRIIKLETTLMVLDKDALPLWLREAQTDAITGLIEELKVEIDEYAKTHDLVDLYKYCDKDDWDFAD